MHNDSLDSPETEVQRLLEERSMLQDWIVRLEERSESVSEKIFRRVSEDYRERLHRVLDSLADHKRSLVDRLEEAERSLAGAEARRAAAIDDLEEATLRSAIGEIDEWSWREREPALQHVVNEANQSREHALAEVERLVEILSQVDDREEDEEAPEPLSAGLEADDEVADSVEFLVETDVSDDGQESLALNGSPNRIEIGRIVVADGLGEGEDEADLTDLEDGVLTELEAALTESATDAEIAVTGTATATDEEADTAPKPGIKCGECGYTNDVNAWFCGVCGADVG